MANGKLCRRRLGWLALVVGLVVQACAPATPLVGSQPPEPTILRVGINPYLSYAPFFIAQEEGFFSEQGLDVQFVELQPATSLPALMQGDVDVAAGLLSAGMLNAIARGGRVRMVADKGHVDPAACAAFALVGRRSLAEAGEASEAEHFRGRKVDVRFGSWHNYFLSELMRTIDVSIDDLVLEDLPSAAEGEALSNGALDFAVSGEPWRTRMLQAGHSSVLLPIQQVMPDAQYSVVLFGPNLLDGDPDAGRRFMVAYLQAVRQLNQGKTGRNVATLAEQTGLDATFLEEACWPAIRADGSINAETVLEFQAWAMARDLLDETVAAVQFWDPSFVEYAEGVLGASSP